jgi:DNA-binding CsgD family transcriptional regulator
MGRPVKILERDDDLKRLRAALAETREGRGRLVLIEGEAGIGKTTLLDGALSSARQRGFEVLTARAGPLEQTIGHGVAVQLFEEPLHTASVARRQKLLAGAAELTSPLLSIRRKPGEDHGPALTESAVQHGLYWLAANMAVDSPLAIAVDDVQWCDRETLRWLHYLERRIDQLPMAILLTLRTGEPDADVDVLRAIAAEPIAETVKPEPLSTEAAGSILENSYGAEVDHDFSSACREWTAGNPFLLTELAAELASEGVDPTGDTIQRMRGINPESISRSALLRLARLGGAAAALAGALAVLGSGGLDLSDAARLAGLSDGDAGSAAEALMSAAILRGGRSLRFAHPVIENVVYAERPAVQRAADHRRAAELLRARGAPAERVAVHLLHSDPSADPWTVERLRDAAQTELARGAPDAAARFLRRALEEPPPAEQRVDTLRELGLAEDLNGQALIAEGHLREALELANSPRQSAEVALELAATLTRQGRFDDGSSVLREQLERTTHPAAQLAVEVQLCLASQFASGGGWREAQERLERLAPSLSGATAEGRAGLAALAVRRGQDAQPASQAIKPARRALEASFAADAGAEVVVQGSAITVLARLDAIDEAEAGAASALERSRAVGSRVGVAQALYLQGLGLRSRGQLAEAAAHVEAAIGVAEQYRPMLAKALGIALLVDVLSERGELDAAGEQLRRRDLLGELPKHAMFGGLLESRGRWRSLTGDPKRAERDLTEAGERHSGWGSISPAFTGWRSACALARLGLGEREAAARLVGEELALARRVGLPRSIGVALRASGLIEGGERGIELLGESVKTLEGSPARLERAWALVDLGAALRRAKRRADARGPLRTGLELAERCGARPLADRALEELRASGARARSPFRSGVEALTPSELRICRMAVEGMSNPEIAQGLFVTRGTVESHLHSSYAKLGIGSRGELAAALSEDPAPPTAKDP